MSDFILSLVPDDPRWQPDVETAERVVDLVRDLTLAAGDGGWLEASWHDDIAVVDCGENLEEIRCPVCGAELDSEWFYDAVDSCAAEDGEGLRHLDVTVPCCATATTLDALQYDRPMAFARFEIEVWNPTKVFDPGDGRLDAAGVAAVEELLGHPIRQIRSHL